MPPYRLVSFALLHVFELLVAGRMCRSFCASDIKNQTSDGGVTSAAINVTKEFADTLILHVIGLKLHACKDGRSVILTYTSLPIIWYV